MQSERSFKLVVKPMHASFSVTGDAGVRPDISLLTDPSGSSWFHQPERTRLPINISKLIFTEVVLRDHNSEMANLYCLWDFFIVDSEMLDFLHNQIGTHMDYAPVDVRRADGSSPPHPYFAVKAVFQINCIDPDNSFNRRHHGTKTVERRFSDAMVVLNLSEQCNEEFSNAGLRKYKSYPNGTFSLGRVQLKNDAIPYDAKLFQDIYWPGYVIGESNFLKLLNSKCRGGFPGYYFWELDLSDVSRSHSQTMMAMK